ncbi:hypothetical protein [Haliangium ochraceum]|uniref:FG-GAP repeat protein n=1 Tax=Haliangium ochraceum (strain DSM 14365 / JCM 11303 / SMP-2) TaxID=502025 RepID=D0LVF2_HALO1|nr:hypothetical protein [Haliangium ochraceum]ACY17513.1 hypothetical protein Hoch_5024 [Haliangium ochraceum DSM 14365]
MKELHQRLNWLALGACACFGLSGCGGDDSGVGGGLGPDRVAESLNALGIDTDQSARVDDEGDPLPEGYSPLGASAELSVTRELLVMGVAPSSAESDMTLLELHPEPLGEDGVQRFDEELLLVTAAEEAPWATARGEEPEALRTAARADIDGDGLDELVVVFWERSSRELFARSYDDAEGLFAVAEPVSLGKAEPLALVAEGGDFDGDGVDELALGLVLADGAELLVLAQDEDGLGILGERRTLRPELAESDIEVALATGNLDFDRAEELVVVLGEQRQRPGSPTQGVARYFAFDDALSDFAEVAREPVAAVLEGGNRSAVSADVAIGDVDGDGVGELLLAGLTHFDPDGDCDYRYLVVALDDYKRALAPLGAREQDPGFAEACSADAPLALRRVHINALDVDGDRLSEIQVNRFIFDDLLSASLTVIPEAPEDPDAPEEEEEEEDSVSSEPLAEIDAGRLYRNDGGYTGVFDSDTSAVVVGDFTGDDREDVAVYSQATNTLDIWGIAEPDLSWANQYSLPLAELAGEGAQRPLLVAPNSDHDGLALKYDGGTYRLIFTEPVVIAALAAAPCFDDLGQNPFSCRTQFGNAESDTVSTEESFTVSASARVGFSQKFSFFGLTEVGLSVTRTVEAHATAATSNTYTLTKSISYSTGPIEDSVIFTTIPYDQYTYTILSHPDPELIGAEVVVSLPRSPVELQVSRGFYNEHVEDGGLRIDDSVFRHRAGDPLSYSSAAAKDAILEAYDGFEVGPQAVGEGGGNESLGINVYTETGSSASWGASFTTDIEATAGGAVAGFSVGVGSDSSLSISHGSDSSYVGTVGNLPAENFSEYGYSFGLYTYVYEDPGSGRQFEVVDYWVE